jgi:hypothetical protein
VEAPDRALIAAVRGDVLLAVVAEGKDAPRLLDAVKAGLDARELH